MIHPSSLVSPNARIGTDVTVGPFTTIHDHVVLEDGCVVEGYCILGYPHRAAGDAPLVVGRGSLIRSHSIFYQGSTFGPGLVTGHRVTVREGTVAGAGLQIGTLSDFQGDCTLGDHVRTHSNVHIGKHSRVGNFVWIFPYVVLTNDPHPPSEVQEGVVVEDYAAIATLSVILPGVTVGEHSLVAAHSMVNRDVPAGMVVGGNPAKVLCQASEIRLRDGSGRPAYPWTTHFTRGYPEDVVRGWEGGGEPSP